MTPVTSPFGQSRIKNLSLVCLLVLGVSVIMPSAHAADNKMSKLVRFDGVIEAQNFQTGPDATVLATTTASKSISHVDTAQVPVKPLSLQKETFQPPCISLK